MQTVGSCLHTCFHTVTGPRLTGSWPRHSSSFILEQSAQQAQQQQVAKQDSLQEQQIWDVQQIADSMDSEESAATAVQQVEQRLQQQCNERQLLSTLAALAGHIQQVYASLPPSSLLLVATGQGDMPEVRRQQELRYKREQRLDGLPAWSSQDEEAFAATLDEQMKALCFCAVKQ